MTDERETGSRRAARTGWPYLSSRIGAGVDGRIHALDTAGRALCGADLDLGGLAVGGCVGCNKIDRGLVLTSRGGRTARAIRHISAGEIERACWALLTGHQPADVARMIGCPLVTLMARLEDL